MDIVWIVGIALLWVASIELVFALGRLERPREQRT